MTSSGGEKRKGEKEPFLFGELFLAVVFFALFRIFYSAAFHPASGSDRWLPGVFSLFVPPMDLFQRTCSGFFQHLSRFVSFFVLRKDLFTSSLSR
jgi:hypothetical protein